MKGSLQQRNDAVHRQTSHLGLRCAACSSCHAPVVRPFWENESGKVASYCSFGSPDSDRMLKDGPRGSIPSPRPTRHKTSEPTYISTTLSRPRLSGGTGASADLYLVPVSLSLTSEVGRGSSPLMLRSQRSGTGNQTCTACCTSQAETS